MMELLQTVEKTEYEDTNVRREQDIKSFRE